MSEAIGIVIKPYTFLEIEKNVLFTALSFDYCFHIMKYTERFFDLELGRSSSMHSMRSSVRLFMPMHKVLLYHRHFATPDSDVGVKFLPADCEEKEKPTTAATI